MNGTAVRLPDQFSPGAAAAVYIPVVSVIYAGGAPAFGYWLRRHYRSKK